MLTVLSTWLLAASTAAAQIPAIAYSGPVPGADAEPVEGTIEVTHSLYRSETDSEPVWQELDRVAASGNAYVVFLFEAIRLDVDPDRALWIQACLPDDVCGPRRPFAWRDYPGIRDEALVGEAVNRKDVDKRIRRRQSRVQRCYRAELQDDPGAAGQVTVRFNISPSGVVERAHLAQTDIESELFGACVLDEIERLRFRRPVDERTVIISYPFVFEAP